MSSNPIQRYELVERIAVGGMAEVFRAKTFGVQGFEKVLAVKRILPELATNSEFVDRFISEAKIAVTLNHANIVQVLDFSRFGESLFIAMEFVEGCDLSALLKGYRQEGRLLPPAVGLHLAIEILKGLNFAHGRNVVHRDISPANILVSNSGEVKIADFGIAQAGDSNGHTNPFQILGKWRYMSPEQSQGMPLAAASDLFSTAVVLYEIFAGRRLFPQDEPAEVVAAIRSMNIPRLIDARPEVSEHLDKIVHKALHDDPAKRGTAAEMMQALIEYSYARSVPVSALELADVVQSFCEGNTHGVQDPKSISDNLIDDIINSELEHQSPGRQTRITRITPVGKQTSDFEDGTTALTFVDGGLGPDGLRQWLIGSAEGGPIQLEAEGESDFDIPTVTEAMPLQPPDIGLEMGSFNLVDDLPRYVKKTRSPWRIYALALALGTAGTLAAYWVTLDASSKRGSKQLLSWAMDAGIATREPARTSDAATLIVKMAALARAFDAGSGATPETSDASSPRRSRKRLSKAVKAKTAKIDLFVKPWANVYYRGRKIAEAPARGVSLPYGTHKLRLENPVTKQKRTVTVTVPATKPYRFTLK